MGASSGDAVEDKKQREEAKDALEQINAQRDVANSYVSKFAKVIKSLIEAGANPDDALADELLGVSSAGQLSALVKTSAKGYGSGAETKVEADDDDGADEGLGSDLMLATLASLMDGGIGGGKDDKTPGGGGGAFGSSSDSKKDKLNLSGLLNVLDGVVDTPERILIMTTNHPEQLDPALIRPGRIDKKILLGYMSPTHATSMIMHYFQTEVSSEQRERLRMAVLGNDAKGIPALNLTPAQVEQLCAEHDELEAMIAALEGKGGVEAAAPAAATPAPLTMDRGEPSDKPARPPMLNRMSSRTVTFDS